MSHVKAPHTQEKLGVQEFSSIQRNRYIILLNTKGKKGKGEGKTGVAERWPSPISDFSTGRQLWAPRGLGSGLPVSTRSFILVLGLL